MFNVSCIPAFEDNYIWLPSASPGRVAIVDPGDADPVLEALEAHGWEPEAILITHRHPDHTGGIEALAARYKLPVFGPARERIAGVTHPVTEGDEVRLNASGLHFRVIDTPGHTAGHVCYLGHGALFCGDTLFTGGCGRLFEGTPQQMHASLMKLAALPDDTRVYCAHEYTLANLAFAAIAEPGNRELQQRQADADACRRRGEPTVPSTLGLEKATNPFLRSGVPALAGAAATFAGHPLADPAEVFATVRHWKDTLD